MFGYGVRGGASKSDLADMVHVVIKIRPSAQTAAHDIGRESLNAMADFANMAMAYAGSILGVKEILGLSER